MVGTGSRHTPPSHAQRNHLWNAGGQPRQHNPPQIYATQTQNMEDPLDTAGDQESSQEEEEEEAEVADMVFETHYPIWSEAW